MDASSASSTIIWTLVILVAAVLWAGNPIIESLFQSIARRRRNKLLQKDLDNLQREIDEAHAEVDRGGTGYIPYYTFTKHAGLVCPRCGEKAPLDALDEAGHHTYYCDTCELGIRRIGTILKVWDVDLAKSIGNPRAKKTKS